MSNLPTATSNTSINGNKWDIPDDYNIDESFLKHCYSDSLLAKIMLRRGISTNEEAHNFFNFENYQMLSGFELPNMLKACEEVTNAIKAQNCITVYGDYDVDGITSTCVLKLLFKLLGYDRVNYVIPNRFTDGYGLNNKAIVNMASKLKTKLIITCDCGVANIDEIKFANSLGIKTIVLDHHNMAQSLPEAIIVHPKLLDNQNHGLYHLSGVGVAFKFAQSMLEQYNLSDKIEEFFEYVALGLIADMVPLIRENRYLVAKGLTKLINTTKPGLKALIEQNTDNKASDLIGYNIAPKINAAGRLSDGAKALELLSTEDANIALSLSEELKAENIKRQELTEKIFDEACLKAKDQLSKNRKVLTLFAEGWHHGVVGIVATRLVEKYKLPVFIGEIMPESKTIKGSARGSEKFDLYQALDFAKESLNKWGGHKVAAGFSLSMLNESKFIELLNIYANERSKTHKVASILSIDYIENINDIKIENYANLHKLEPFGMANPKPQFLAYKAQVTSSFWLGKKKQHLKVNLATQDNNTIEAMIWSCYYRAPKPGEIIDIVYTPQIKTFKDKPKLTLIINDIMYSDQDINDSQLDVLESLENEIEAITTCQTQNIIDTKKPIINENTIINTNSLLAKTATIKIKDFKWHDLRSKDNINQIITAGQEKLGNNLILFSDDISNEFINRASNRFEIDKSEHLFLCDIPPSKEILQQIIHKASPKSIYLSGFNTKDSIDVNIFIKKTIGLIRYTVNKCDGCNPLSKFALKLQTTNESIISCFEYLSSIDFLNYEIDEDTVFVDLNDFEISSMQINNEFEILKSNIDSINYFRKFILDKDINDIKNVIFSNSININTKIIENNINSEILV